MKNISLEELKQIQLEMLCKIHQFCQCQNIRYSLAYGTLIGAIRHNGYIPWDDDIDIMMPRPDYDVFLKTFNGTFPELEVIAPEISWKYHETYANVYDNRTLLKEETVNHRGNDLGIKIDVFPIDGVPTDDEHYIAHDKRMKNSLKNIGYKKWGFNTFIKAWKYNKKSIFVPILKSFQVSLFTYENLQKQHHRMAIAFAFDKSSFVDNVVFNTSSKLLRQPRECFENYEEISFEGYLFKIIKGYDSFLRSLYGDYMELPPMDKRVPHHGFTAYWK